MAIRMILFVLVSSFLLASAASGSITLTRDTTITRTDMWFENQDLEVVGCTVTIQGAHTFHNLSIEWSGGDPVYGKVTHPVGDTTGLNLTITHALYIQDSCSIDVNGRGHSDGIGQGHGFSSGTYGGGGGFGGDGGNGTSCLGGAGYGTIGNPDRVGSGGGGSSAGHGGGLIHLVVGDSVVVSGTITADGGNTTGNGGGGSGGSIWIQTNGVTLYAAYPGGGRITANGGNGQASHSGGGGGGRIYIRYGTLGLHVAPSASIRAWGGSGVSNGRGGAGTIFKRGPTVPYMVTINNNFWVGAQTRLYYIPPSSDVSLDTNAVCICDSDLVVFGRSLYIYAGSVLMCKPHTATRMNVSGDLWLMESAVITANSLGYSSNDGPGAGGADADSGGGGAYGGNGAEGRNARIGGLGYGSVTEPLDLGSGGGGNLGGSGGGALRLDVSGALKLWGEISAEGQWSGVGGGGSGGSIYIETTNLQYNGVLNADGGNGGPGSGGGGGGRISVKYDVSTFTGSMHACGGSGYNRGGAGTVYTQQTGNTGELGVDNCGNSGASTLLFSLPHINVTICSSAVAQPTVPLNIAKLMVGANSSLTALNETPMSVGATNVWIRTGGTITASGRGYDAEGGPGAGKSVGGMGSGGGFGGSGGLSNSGAEGGWWYGLPACPSDMGSGGGTVSGGRGGGSIYLASSDTVRVDGYLTANGNTSLSISGGHGSGGGIRVSAGYLRGTGYITANGAGGSALNGGSGGGGRIAFYICGSSFPVGNVTANGGAGLHPGQNGTIWWGGNDVNSNGVADGCELHTGAIDDCNLNGVPDETEVNGDITTVTAFYNVGQLTLRWACIPDYRYYIVYGKNLGAAELPLDTLESNEYDATPLVTGSGGFDSWVFHVHGYNP